MNEAGSSSGERTFGLLDHAALWGSLGASLYIMPFGALLVPALSLEQAFAAVLLAGLLGALLIGAVAALAARSGLSTVELIVSLLGERARPLAAALLLLRHVVWGAFALSLIAASAEIVSERAVGAGARPLWVIVFGLLGVGLAVLGPEFVVRRILRRAGVWLALLVAGAITLSAYLEFGTPTYLQRPAAGGWPSFWQAVDVMLVAPLLWLPLVPDFARRGRDAGSAFWGSGIGILVAAVWLGFLGVLYLPAVGTGDISGFVVGMQMGMGALIVLLILQSDEVFANVHSASVVAESLSPRRAGALPIVFGGGVIALALPFDLVSAEGWLLLLGSLFVPLFGVILAAWLIRPVTESGGAYPALAGWAMGFFVYQWIAPADAGWWHDALRWLLADVLSLPFPLGDEITWLGAALPSLLLASGLYAVLHTVGELRRRVAIGFAS